MSFRGSRQPDFTLRDWSALLATLDPDARERVSVWQERHPSAHRARADAESFLLALAHGLGLEPGLAELDVGEASRDAP